MSDIDFVVTWVDGNDPEWRQEKHKYENKAVGDLRDERYREWDNIKYWFRAIEKCAPWYCKVHFVTYGHKPAWLNINHPRLRLVRHKDYIPQQYLPTFSARPIEFFLHKIPDLTDRFVYFNDDMFLIRPVTEGDFFKNGLPLEMAVLNCSIPQARSLNGKPYEEQELYFTNVCNAIAINRHFDKNEALKKNWRKWLTPKYGPEVARTLLLLPWRQFLGFSDTHVPYSLLKSTFEEVWVRERESLEKACAHKFREPMDVSGRLLTLWQIASGNFEPRPSKDCGYFKLTDDAAKNAKIFRTIAQRKHKMICVNDKVSNDNFESVRDNLNSVFAKMFPEKSSFEL